MDYTLPDDATMEKMRRAYAEQLDGKTDVLCYVPDAKSVAPERFACAHILLLYIALLLRYNVAYGNQIFDTHGSVGGIRRSQSAFGSVNNLGTSAR